jgi:hypothetical protein
LNTIWYANWVLHPKYTIVNTAKKIKELTGENAIIAGNAASTFALENNLLVINPVPKKAANENVTIRDMNVTHAILIGNSPYEMDLPKERSPTLLEKFKVLDNYYTGDNCYLYQFNKTI